jgi:hypothetical protein
MRHWRAYLYHVTAVISGEPTARRPRIAGAATAITRLGRRTATAAKNTAERLSGSLLTAAGLGCVDTGAFQANTVAGWVVTGLSILLFDAVRE